MWIQTNAATVALHDTEITDEPVDFSSNGTAQVSQDVGEALIEKYDAITTYDK